MTGFGAVWGARRGRIREKIHRGLWYGRVRTDQGLGVAELVVAALLEDLRGGGGGTTVRRAEFFSDCRG